MFSSWPLKRHLLQAVICIVLHNKTGPPNVNHTGAGLVWAHDFSVKNPPSPCCPPQPTDGPSVNHLSMPRHVCWPESGAMQPVLSEVCLEWLWHISTLPISPPYFSPCCVSCLMIWLRYQRQKADKGNVSRSRWWSQFTDTFFIMQSEGSEELWFKYSTRSLLDYDYKQNLIHLTPLPESV